MSTTNPTLPLLDKKIAFSTIVQYGGKGLQLAFSILNLKLISAFLSTHDYGTYAAIAEFTLFFTTAANLGIFGNVVRRMADAPGDGKIFINAMVLRVATFFAFFAGAIITLAITGADRIFILGSVLYFGSLFFDNVKSVCDGMLQANYMMGRSTLALIMGKVVQFGGVLILVKLLGNNGAIFGGVYDIALVFLPFLAGSLISVGMTLWFVRSRIKWSNEISKSLMLGFLLSSLPFGIINIINNLYFRFLPDYFANMALTGEQFASFSVSFRIAQVVSLASTFLMFSVLPGFKNALDQGHLEKAKKLYKQIKLIILAGGAALVVFGGAAGPFLIGLLSHQKYIVAEFWFLLPLMFLLAAVSYGYDLVLIILFALEKELWFLKREVMALAAALAVFGLSFLAADPALKLLLIIAGAITGESFMVISGLLKIKKVEFNTALR
jgi:O-antigen/teichoic acid export membrane protein